MAGSSVRRRLLTVKQKRIDEAKRASKRAGPGGVCRECGCPGSRDNDGRPLLEACYKAFMGEDGSKSWKRLSRSTLVYKREDGQTKRMDWSHWSLRMTKEKRMVYLKEQLFFNPDAYDNLEQLKMESVYNGWMDDTLTVPFELYGRKCDRCRCKICDMHSLSGDHPRCLERKLKKKVNEASKELILDDDDEGSSSPVSL